MNLKKLQKIILWIVLFVILGVGTANAAVETVADITFDGEYYVNSYSDLKQAYQTNTNDLRNHFATYGIGEGRVASLVFDINYYLENNPDVKNVYGEDYEQVYRHFLVNGIKEGRMASPIFDVKYYLANNQDVANAFGAENYENAYQHFLMDGVNEGRITSPNFDVRHYIVNSSDLSAAFGTNYKAAYEHYLRYGIHEAHRVTSADAHVYYEFETKNATCTEDGRRSYECIACGIRKTEVLEKTGHTVVEEPEKAATCGEDGHTAGTKCSVCGEILTGMDVISKENIEHTWKTEGTVYEPATCIAKGKTEYECEVCGQTKIEEDIEINTNEEGHHYEAIESELNRPATCQTKGVQVYICTLCPEETENHGKIDENITAEHTPDEGTLISKATGKENPSCTEDRYLIIACTECGTTIGEPEEVPAGQHTLSEVQYTKQPTCEQGGYELALCSVCGRTESKPLEKLPHVWEVVTPATCKNAETESVASIKCKNCTTYDNQGKGTLASELYEAGILSEEQYNQYVPTEEHYSEVKVGEGTEITHATCVNDGEETVTCKYCAQDFTRKIPATGIHNWKTYKIINEADCQTQTEGTESQICLDCKATQIHKIEAKHEFEKNEDGTIKFVTEPKSGENGTAKCIKCNQVEEVLDTALPVDACKEEAMNEFSNFLSGSALTRQIPGSDMNYNTVLAGEIAAGYSAIDQATDAKEVAEAYEAARKNLVEATKTYVKELLDTVYNNGEEYFGLVLTTEQYNTVKETIESATTIEIAIDAYEGILENRTNFEETQNKIAEEFGAFLSGSALTRQIPGSDMNYNTVLADEIAAGYSAIWEANSTTKLEEAYQTSRENIVKATKEYVEHLLNTVYEAGETNHLYVTEEQYNTAKETISTATTVEIAIDTYEAVLAARLNETQYKAEIYTWTVVKPATCEMDAYIYCNDSAEFDKADEFGNKQGTLASEVLETGLLSETKYQAYKAKGGKDDWQLLGTTENGYDTYFCPNCEAEKIEKHVDEIVENVE